MDYIIAFPYLVNAESLFIMLIFFRLHYAMYYFRYLIKRRLTWKNRLSSKEQRNHMYLFMACKPLYIKTGETRFILQKIF